MYIDISVYSYICGWLCYVHICLYMVICVCLFVCFISLNISVIVTGKTISTTLLWSQLKDCTVYVYIGISVYLCILYICIYLYIGILVCLYADVCICLYIGICISIYLYIHTYVTGYVMCIYDCIQIYVYMCISVYLCILYICMCLYICIFVYLYMCVSNVTPKIIQYSTVEGSSYLNTKSEGAAGPEGTHVWWRGEPT